MRTTARLAAFVRKPPVWAIVLAAALATFIAARLTILAPITGGPNHIVTAMWAPAGVAFALVWYFGGAAILGSSLGMFLFVFEASGHPLFSLLAAIGHVLPAGYASWQLRRNGITNVFSSPRGVLQFVIFAVFIAPLLSSSFGVLLPLLAPSAGIHWHLAGWFALWANEALGMLLIAPLLLRLHDWGTLSRRGWLELLGIVLGTLVLWWQIFVAHPRAMASPLAALTMPLLMLTAFRFRYGIVAGISLLLATLSLASFAHPPYTHDRHTFLFAVAYLTTLGLSNLAVGAGSAALRTALRRITASEGLLRGMFDHAAVGLMLYDLQKDKRTFNPRFGEMLGYPDKEIEQGDLRSISFPEEQDVTQQLARQLQQGEIDSFNQEKRYIRADGEVIWTSLTMSALREEHGAATYLIGAFEDITARKRVEQQLTGQTRVLQLLTQGTATLPELLRDLALLAEELWSGSHCAIFLADADARYLHFGAAPSIPESALSRAAAIAIAESADPAAMAAAQQRTVICADTVAAPQLAAEEPSSRARWAAPFTAKNGELLGVLSFAFDRPRTPTAQDDELIATLGALAGIVVQHHRDEEKLRDSEERFRITFEQAAVGVALLDRDANWLQVNEKFCDIVGYPRDELLQLQYNKLIAPEDKEHTAETLFELLHGSAGQISMDHRYMRKNGDTIWVSSQFSVTRDADGNIDHRIAVIKDITERKRAEAEVERLALYDYLTGLPNRRLFGDRLRTAVMAAKRSARYGAVIYIDLDNFKQLNDSHGHNTGDEFLKMVAERLQRNLREEDTVARLGGDEFVILLQNVSNSLEETAEATAAIAEKIQAALSEPFLLPSDIEHIVTSSLGITLFPKDADNAEDLLKEADIAMYRVKESRRNAMRFYEPAMKAAVDSRLALERALRRALHGDEFELYLQPQFDAERNMVSCEALLRWPQPGGKFISPGEFIPIAEETGLIVPLGEWVLRRAGTLLRSLALAGHGISIAVNVSPRQFNEANFVERVRTILWETGADPGHVMLEITEGVVVADFDDVRTKMHALRRMGIQLSVDDFGTGHSSLAYLKLLPLHELKIDRAFVDSLPEDANDVAIVEAVLSVARHLQLEIVAEGVETEAQFEFLKQRGCQRFQGYLLARPAPPHQHFPGIDEAAPPAQRRDSQSQPLNTAPKTSS